MYAGRIVEQAPTSVLFSHMLHPYTEALLRSIPKVEDPSHTRLRVITGRPPDLTDPPPGCKFAPRCPYVQDRCRVEEPKLVVHGSRGHTFACHFPLGTEENVAGLEANIAAGLPQAIALLDAQGEGEVDLSALLAADTASEAVDWSGEEGGTTDDDVSSRAGGTRDV
jgi:peptide/nickel transport system ATP-binding protein